MTGNETGAWVEVQLDSRLADDGESASQQQRAVGAGAPAPAPAPQQQLATLLLGYMKSYESMGNARVTCVAGCSCEPSTLQGRWERRATVRQFHAFQVRRRRWARGRLRALPGAARAAASRCPLPGAPLLPQASQHATCRIRVSILAETETDGHKVSLTTVALSPEPPDALSTLDLTWENGAI